MSGSGQPHDVFAGEPSAENNWIAYDPIVGKLRKYPHEGMDEETANVFTREVLDPYDATIKKTYGPEHFHGEKGLPLAMGLRVMLGYS